MPYVGDIYTSLSGPLPDPSWPGWTNVFDGSGILSNWTLANGLPPGLVFNSGLIEIGEFPGYYYAQFSFPQTLVIYESGSRLAPGGCTLMETVLPHGETLVDDENDVYRSGRTAYVID